MKRIACLLLAVVALTACSGYMKVMYGEGPASEDYRACLEKTGMNNAFDIATDRCMKERGWAKLPEPQPYGPNAYQRVAP